MKSPLTAQAVKEYGITAGADLVGIASAKAFVRAPEGFKPVDVLPECKSIIVLGATFPHEVLNDIDEYTKSRNAMLTAMTDRAISVAKKIKSNGYKSKAISSSGGKWVQCDGRKEQFGHISLKHAAELAGLGVIGKNYLLINPEFGTLLWLSAVLTEAELTPDERPALTSICDNCAICVEACPVGALNDLNDFGKKGCSSHFKIENKKLRIKCYLCRTICPHCFGIKS